MSKFSKEMILKVIADLKDKVDRDFLISCEVHGDNALKTDRMFERCKTMNHLINLLNPAPRKTGYVKKGASKILKSINQ